MNYIGIIEYLTKSRAIRDGKFDDALKEILEKSAEGLEVERVNAWAADRDFSKITCLGAYVRSTKKFSKGQILYRKDLPEYFKRITTAEKMVSDDALNTDFNKELIESYIKPLGITSMMDVPVRVEGEMVGIVCFEHVGPKRLWNLSDQSFGLSIAQLISLTVETYKKNEYRKKLENSLNEKEVLLNEINHRVKNNMNIISSILSLQKHRAKDDYHIQLLEDCREKVISMSFVHDQLYKSKNYTEIDFGMYLESLLEHLESSFGAGKSISIAKNIDHVQLDIRRAIPCGLITNEIVTNAYKYAFKNRNQGKLNVQFKREGMLYKLNFFDDGPGLNEPVKKTERVSAGLGLVEDLVEQIDGKMEIYDKEGAHFDISFPI